MAGFERTLRRLEFELEEMQFTRGAQLAVDYRGERVFDVGLGDAGTGEPMTPEHVFRVYCTIKPFLAVAVANLVDTDVLDLDEPLGPRLPEVELLRNGVTLQHVLTHTAGLHTVQGIPMEMVAPERRRRIVEKARLPAPWRVGVAAAYSEYAAWNIMGWLVEDVTGEPLREHLRAQLLDPLELTDTFIGMTSEQYREVLPRLGVNHDMRGLQSYPMLFERTERVCTETNPAHGGYTTARDLARFYRALLDRLADEDDEATDNALPASDVLDEFCTTARPPVFDEVLDRVCPFGLGFMTELDQHAFGDACSPSSFGHSGNVGASFAFADPERDLAVGVVFNGLIGYDAAFLRRRALLRALYLDLDDLDADADEFDNGDGNGEQDQFDPAAAEQEPTERRGWFRRAGKKPRR
jgi:CubicO group peptidase (beta-lactamase class C family)